jgi:FK506-binding protein 1
MGVNKTILQEGNGPVPQKGQKVTIEYTGWLKDPSKPDNKGKQ